MQAVRKIEQTVWRPNAPFRQYAETDESMYADGLKSGQNWPAKWAHVPGGPYYPEKHNGDHPDWVAYCRLLRHHNKVWLDGWHEGFRQNALSNPEIRRLRTKLLLVKLVGE